MDQTARNGRELKLGGTVPALLQLLRKTFGMILPLNEVKRRAICEAFRQVRRELSLSGGSIGNAAHRSHSLLDSKCLRMSAELLKPQ